MWRRLRRDTATNAVSSSTYAAGLPAAAQLQESVTNDSVANAELVVNNSPAGVLEMDETKHELEMDAKHELCPICHEEAGTDVLATTGCKHHYHQPCLERWKNFSRGQLQVFRCPVW